ncbi:MAG: Uncharacterised protein [Gammaproteobacteria bacterium]|nr:MAG: Uncharacterised protein [Gammaproteobacteria bacterium]
MAFFRHFLKYPLANTVGYNLLRKQVKVCHWLMGIGAGTDVNDSGESTVMRKLLRQKNTPLTVIDAGANRGQFLNLAFSRLGSQLKEIHSFEPAAATFSALLECAPKNPAVILNNLALGAETGERELYYDAECSGLASLTKRDLSFKNREFEKHETIRLTTLSDYCSEKKIEHIGWLKIDVEGHELDVLRGAKPLFVEGKIDVVTMEFGGCNIDTRTFLRDFHNFFKEFGMQLHRITPGGYMYPIKRYREAEEQFITMNLVAFRTK